MASVDYKIGQYAPPLTDPKKEEATLFQFMHYRFPPEPVMGTQAPFQNLHNPGVTNQGLLRLNFAADPVVSGNSARSVRLDIPPGRLDYLTDVSIATYDYEEQVGLWFCFIEQFDLIIGSTLLERLSYPAFYNSSHDHYVGRVSSTIGHDTYQELALWPIPFSFSSGYVRDALPLHLLDSPVTIIVTFNDKLPLLLSELLDLKLYFNYGGYVGGKENAGHYTVADDGKIRIAYHTTTSMSSRDARYSVLMSKYGPSGAIGYFDPSDPKPATIQFDLPALRHVDEIHAGVHDMSYVIDAIANFDINDVIRRDRLNTARNELADATKKTSDAKTTMDSLADKLENAEQDLDDALSATSPPPDEVLTELRDVVDYFRTAFLEARDLFYNAKEDKDFLQAEVDRLGRINSAITRIGIIPFISRLASQMALTWFSRLQSSIDYSIILDDKEIISHQSPFACQLDRKLLFSSYDRHRRYERGFCRAVEYTSAHRPGIGADQDSSGSSGRGPFRLLIGTRPLISEYFSCQGRNRPASTLARPTCSGSIDLSKFTHNRYLRIDIPTTKFLTYGSGAFIDQMLSYYYNQEDPPIVFTPQLQMTDRTDYYYVYIRHWVWLVIDPITRRVSIES